MPRFFGKQARQVHKDNEPAKMTPTEEDIETLIGFTACSREQAVRALKAKTSVEQAANAIFDGDDLTQDTWDESAWTADRDTNLKPLGAPTRESTPYQEQGVIRPDGTVAPIYGPEHNPQQWALIKAPIVEVTPDIPAPDRQGAPRFLKGTEYLPSFLTICHTVPAARNVFINEAVGSHPDWWKGHPVDKIVEIGQPQSPYTDFVAETARCMAFLDGSTRAYASTANLERFPAIAGHGQSQITSHKSNITTFLLEYAHAVGKQRVEDVFGLVAGPGSQQIMEIFHFDTAVPNTLYNMLDDILWDEDEERYLEKLPKVLVMRLKQQDNGNLRVKAPGTLYMDKYLKQNLDVVKPIRQQMLQNKARLAKIDDIDKRLRHWHVKDKRIDAHALLSQVSSNPAVNTLIENITTKLEELAAERLKIQDALQTTTPVQDNPYTLVGIATKPGITYVLQPGGEQIDANDETPSGFSWWRLEYVMNGVVPSMSRSIVASYDALSAIEHEHNTALLVYATLDATEPIPLPPGLQEFVSKDNAYFATELAESQVVVQSIERKASTDSLAAQGSAHGDFDADPTQHATFNLGYGPEYDDDPVTEVELPPESPK